MILQNYNKVCLWNTHAPVSNKSKNEIDLINLDQLL